MLRRSMVSLCAVMSLCALAQAESTIYIGSLGTGDGGLITTAGSSWASGVTFGWAVQQNADGSWHYKYDFTRAAGVQGSLSHLILETSGNLQLSDITNATPSLHEDPKTHTLGGGNPSLPGSIFGLKFEPFSQSEQTATIEFDSTRAPMWGDFYAKDGSIGGSLWNQGFLASDPTDAPSGGSVNYHVLVPDTTITAIPAPGAMILSGLGTALISWLRRRRVV